MEELNTIDALWVILCAILVLIMQAGFLCLESGFTRSKNAINVALKNTADLLITVLVFWVIGFGIMFGDASSGINNQWTMADFSGASLQESSFFIFQLTFCATAGTIVSGAIAERARFSTYIILTLVISAFIYPVFGNWAWGGIFDGTAGWLEAQGFVDFAGSTVVHSVGGWVALAAIIMVGARTGRFADAHTNQQITASNLPMAMLGIMFFLVGWIGFNAGSALKFDSHSAAIIVNTLIAATAGGAAAVMFNTLGLSKINVNGIALNGTLAGLVAITASCHAVTTPEAAFIGIVGAACYIAATQLLIHYRLDDAVGAVPVHLAAGIWGTMAVAIFGDPEILGTGLSTFDQLFIQAKGIVICGLYTFSISILLLWIINKYRPLRVTKEAEELGLNISEHGASTELYQLLHSMTDHENLDGLSKRVPVEPFTEVGLIAKQYNNVIDKLDRTLQRTSLIIKDMRDGIITFNDQGLISSFNPGAELMFATNSQTAIGKPASILLHNENEKLFKVSSDNLLLDLVTRSPEHSHELFGKKANGQAFDIEISTSSSIAKDGRQHTAVIRDITDRKRMEEQVHRHSELAQVTLESIKEAVITCDNDALIIHINNSAMKLLGKTNVECYKQHIDTLVKLSPPNKAVQPITEILKSQQDSEHDLILNRENGEPCNVHCNWSKMRSSKGHDIGFVIALRDITQSRSLQNQLSFQAAHDSLTGLYNRHAFEMQLQTMINEAKRERADHTICYMDLDQFKLVNDTCGHKAGDELLRQLSVSLKNKLRQADYLGRLGGDEFAVLLSHCDMKQGLEIAEELRDLVSNFRFNWDNKSFAIGVSIGVVQINENTVNRSDVLSQADAACYAAKDLGRNRVHAYVMNDKDLSARQGEMQWATRIQEAIDQDRLRLYYQSIVSTKDTNQKSHYEIFIRMLDQNNKIIPPGAFIPAAERYHLMHSIDKWVVRNTLAWMGDASASGIFVDSCAINLSGVSIGDEKFLEEIKSELKNNHLIAKQVCFEITETAAMSDLSRAQYFIEELKALGCKFSLDDFGSGLSSFGYLKNLPVDYLKIDGIFIRDIATNSVDRAMVESINHIGHIMNLETIAEYVENEESLKILQDIGVDYAQGYHIDKPTPLEELGVIKLMAR